MIYYECVNSNKVCTQSYDDKKREKQSLYLQTFCGWRDKSLFVCLCLMQIKWNNSCSRISPFNGPYVPQLSTLVDMRNWVILRPKKPLPVIHWSPPMNSTENPEALAQETASTHSNGQSATSYIWDWRFS